MHRKFILQILIIFTLFASCKTSAPVKKQDVPENKGFNYEVLSLFMEANREKIIGNFGNARALFAESIRRDPKNHAAMYELASILAMDENYKDAEILAKKALELDKNNEWYYFLLAELYQQQQQYKEAYKVLEKLTKAFPDNLAYHYELAIVYLYASELKKAVRVYDNIESRIGITEDISLQKQAIYLYMKKPKLAIKEVEALINVFPDEVKYLLILAETYTQINDNEKALKLYNKVLEIDPNNTLINFSLADYYRSIGQNDKSFEHLKLAFYNPDIEIETKINILISYYQLTENDLNKDLKIQAYELMDILLKTHPDDAVAYSIYGDFLSRDNKLSEAGEMFYKVLEYSNNKYIIWEQLLKIELDLKNYKNLDSLSDIALELFPEQVLLYLFSGYANFNLKNYEKAAKSFKSGLIYSLFSKELQLEFYMYLAESYNHLKNYPESDAAFDNALKIDPENAYILNNYSYYLSLRGEKLEKAKEMSKKSNTIMPKSSSFQDTYAWVLYKLEDYENALIWLEKALDNNGSNNAVIIEHYGDVLYRLDKKEEAFIQWEKALDIGNGSSLLEKKIDNKTLIE